MLRALALALRMFLVLFFIKVCSGAAATATTGTLMSDRRVCGDGRTSRDGLADAILGGFGVGLSWSTTITGGGGYGMSALTWINPPPWSVRR